MPVSEDDLARMAQRFYEVASDSEEITFANSFCKPVIIEALRAALGVLDKEG